MKRLIVLASVLALVSITFPMAAMAANADDVMVLATSQTDEETVVEEEIVEEDVLEEAESLEEETMEEDAIEEAEPLEEETSETQG